MKVIKLPQRFTKYPEQVVVDSFDLSELPLLLRGLDRVTQVLQKKLTQSTEIDRANFDTACAAMQIGRHNAEKAADCFRTGELLDQEGAELPSAPLEIPIYLRGDFMMTAPHIVWTNVIGTRKEDSFYGFQIARPTQQRLLLNFGLFQREGTDAPWTMQSGAKISGIKAANNWVAIDRFDFLGIQHGTQPSGYIRKPYGWLIGTEYFTNGNLEGSGLHEFQLNKKSHLLGRYRAQNLESPAMEAGAYVSLAE